MSSIHPQLEITFGKAVKEPKVNSGKDSPAGIARHGKFTIKQSAVVGAVSDGAIEGTEGVFHNDSKASAGYSLWRMMKTSKENPFSCLHHHPE